MMQTPAPNRAAFTQDDLRLLRAAVGQYLKTVENKPESARCGVLFNRLNQLS